MTDIKSQVSLGQTEYRNHLSPLQAHAPALCVKDTHTSNGFCRLS